MKVLVLLAFAVLGCSLAGAGSVSKCQLRDLLVPVFKTLQDNFKGPVLGDKVVAKVVCHVEQLSNFNTSAVTEPKPQMGKAGKKDSSESGSSSDSDSHSGEQGQKSGKAPTLYGLFQLPGGVVCSNDTSANLCGINCNALTDDDISDDISCLVKLFKEILQKGPMTPNSREIWEIIMKLIDNNCKKVDQYFNNC